MRGMNSLSMRNGLRRWAAGAGGPGASGGFTLTDLMVLLATVSVLAAIAVAAVGGAKSKAALAVCTGNLQKINRALLQFSSETGGRLPAPVVDDSRALWWWYKEQVKPLVGLTGPSSAQDMVFACPRDRGYTDRIPFHLNGRFDFSSYVYNGVTLPGMPNIAGLQVSGIQQPKKTLLAMEWTAHAPLSWHRSRTGKNNMPFYCDAQSVTGFVDGHVGLTRIYYDGYSAAYTQDPIDGYEYKYSAN